MRAKRDPTNDIIIAAAARVGMSKRELRDRTCIGRNAWYGRQARPTLYTLGELRAIVKATRMSDEDIVALMKGV